MATGAPSASTDYQAKANEFVDKVKTGTRPLIHEPLTPAMEAAVELAMAPEDEANKAKVRLELAALKEAAKPAESKEGSLAFLFEGAKSDLMKGAPALLDALIDPELATWKPALTSEQKENIKLATLDRIVSGAASQALFGSMKAKLEKVSEKFTKFNFKDMSLESLDGITKEFSLTDSDDKKNPEGGMESTIKKQIETILSQTLGQIRTAHESNPQPTGFTDLLMHPKALADYKTGEDITALLDRSGNALLMRTAYREGIKDKILSLESSILSAEGKKNKVMDLLAKLPESFSGKLIGSLEWLFKIPLLGDLIAAFFGYNSGKTLIDNLKLETRDRKSIQSLMEFGLKKNDKGEEEKGENIGKIKVLENIDFSTVDMGKLKPFYKILRTNSVNPNSKDFWKVVFTEGKMEIGEEGKKKTILFAKWEEGKETAQTIVEKLNKATSIQEEKVTPAPVGPTALAEATQAKNPDKIAPAVVASGAAASTTIKSEAKASTTTPATPASTPSSLATTGNQSPGTKPAEVVKNLPERSDALQSAFLEAKSLPFTISHTGGTEIVSTTGNTLSIGTARYSIAGKLGPLAIPAKDISLSASGVTLVFPGKDPVELTKQEFAPHAGALLAYKVGEKKEIKRDDDALIVTRTA